MPPSRSTSASSASGFKRNVPFKPPGPASSGKAAPTTTKGATASRRTSNISHAGKPKGKGPEVLRPDSSSSSEEDEDFGTTIDLEEDFDLPTTKTTAAGTTNQRTTNNDRSGDMPFVIDSELDMDSDNEPNPAPAATTSTTTGQTAEGQTPFDADEVQELPRALLARLVHENFDDKTVRMSKTANEVLARYMNIFMREAVARAAEGKKERLGVGSGGMPAEEEIWLDVEDLERVTGGLLLDF
ncbi:hypothetical protein MBLNU457_g0045t1 [Dothideomycetes sp. NU457]